MNILSQTVPIQFDTGFSPYSAAGWREAFADVARRGLTGVEIAVAYPDQVDAEDVMAEAIKNGLAITTISTGQIYALEGAYLTAPDPKKRKQAQDVLRGHIDLSAKLNRPPVTIGLIRGKMEPGEPAALLMLLGETLLPLCDYALERGVTLQFEAINKSETSIINSMEECLTFFECLGNPPALGVLYDTYHSNLEDGDVLSAIKSAKGRITNVHLADSHRGLPGEGTIDFKAIYLTLMETGYAGAIALETQCVPSKEHVLANYANSIFGVVS